jgi:hypothetical protein
MLLLIPVIAFGQNDAYPKSDASLVAWYKLDGDVLDQISGSSGTIVGNIVTTTPKRGNGAYKWMTGTDSYMATVNPTLLNGKTAYTFSMWLNLYASVNSYNAAFAIRGTGANAVRLYSIQQFAPPSYEWWPVWENGPAAVSFPISSQPAWTHVIYSYDGSKVRLYVFQEAGLLANYQQIVLSWSVFQDRVAYLFADPGDVHNRWFPGSIDDVMIWDRALSMNEINLLHCNRYRQTLGELSSINQGQGLGIGD